MMTIKTCPDSEASNECHMTLVAYGDKSKSEKIVKTDTDAFRPGKTDEFDVREI